MATKSPNEKTDAVMDPGTTGSPTKPSTAKSMAGETETLPKPQPPKNIPISKRAEILKCPTKPVRDLR